MNGANGVPSSRRQWRQRLSRMRSSTSIRWGSEGEMYSAMALLSMLGFLVAVTKSRSPKRGSATGSVTTKTISARLCSRYPLATWRLGRRDDAPYPLSPCRLRANLSTSMFRLVPAPSAKLPNIQIAIAQTKSKERTACPPKPYIDYFQRPGLPSVSTSPSPPSSAYVPSSRPTFHPTSPSANRSDTTSGSSKHGCWPRWGTRHRCRQICQQLGDQKTDAYSHTSYPLKGVGGMTLW